MSDLVLWSYDASPFTQKALCMLGLKRASWQWVETPMMPPKDDLEVLTGGYRGTPVLQAGADVYIDSQLIARELERRLDGPTLFPAGAGTELMLVRWSDAFFRAGLKLALALTLPQWPAEFRKDREYLFPDIDFATVGEDFEHAKSQFRAHADLLERQLGDGRDFLCGTAAGLADIQAYPFVWLSRGSFPDLAVQLLDGMPALARWEQRMLAIGEGSRVATSARAAHEIARKSAPLVEIDVNPLDAAGLAAGSLVDIEPDDTRRGAVRGELVVATPAELAVRRTHAATGQVVVHFPRLGYRLRPVA